MSSDSTALVQREQGSIVRASGDIAEALKEYQKIQQALDRAMPDCIMKIQGREFRKKHYWRAIATAFNLNVECVKEERTGGDFLEPNTGYLVTYRATAPNGRYADGDGSCFSSEKKNSVQKTAHNIRSHAHTRAFNRAVSNLVGFGEVSADEVDQDAGQPDEPGSHDGPPPEDRRPPRDAAQIKTISEPQRRRLYAISKRMQESSGMTDDELKDVMTAILKKHGFDSSTDVTVDKYETICDEVASRG